MIQSALEDNNMDKAKVYKGKSVMQSVGRTRKNFTKPPHTVDKIKSISNKIRRASQLMIFDEFDICYGAAIKVVKQDMKNR